MSGASRQPPIKLRGIAPPEGVVIHEVVSKRGQRCDCALAADQFLSNVNIASMRSSQD